MNSILIRDQSFGCGRVPPERSESLPDLARRSSDLLGYKLPDDVVEQYQTSDRKQDSSNEIRDALGELDDPPFTNASVYRYKKAQATAAIPWREKLVVCALWCAAALAMTACATGLMTAAFWVIGPTTLFASKVAGVITLFTFAVVCISLLTAFLATRWEFSQGEWDYKTTEATWSTYSLAGYEHPVPEFAMQTAVDLKDRFPATEFHIEQLTVTEKHHPLALSDPFLVVELPDKSLHYLEVWNEPEFDAKRIA